MPIKHIILAIIIGVGILSLILELIRRRKLLEEYAILWIVTGIALLVMAVNTDLLISIAGLLDIKIPVLALLLFSIIFLILVCLQFSIKLTEHSQKIKNMAQELSLLKNKLGKKDSSLS